MKNLFISPVDSSVWRGVVMSFLFEMVARRLSSSLETRLRFTPTNIFPYFPLPWEAKYSEELRRPDPFGRLDEIESEPKFETLGAAADELLDLRTSLLSEPESHGLPSGLIGGPTALYNLYNRDIESMNATVRKEAKRAADSEPIERLRRAHVVLLNAVLRAYGWDDLADRTDREDWTFERPWLDRTERFVPPEPVRAELFARIDDLNSRRFEQERDMMVGVIADHLPEDGLSKTAFSKRQPFADMPIDSDQFETFMEWDATDGEGRVTKKGSRWYST